MSRVWGAALRGVDGIPVEVEVRISSQLPRIDIVGLPEATGSRATSDRTGVFDDRLFT